MRKKLCIEEEEEEGLAGRRQRYKRYNGERRAVVQGSGNFYECYMIFFSIRRFIRLKTINQVLLLYVTSNLNYRIPMMCMAVQK